MNKITVISKAFYEKYWDNYIEKAMSHKYIRKIPNSKGGYYYIYPKDFSKPLKVLLSVFGLKEEKIDSAYEKQNIQAEYGATKKDFASHVLEYLSNRATWNKFFNDKFNRDRYKDPIKFEPKKSELKAKVENGEIKNNGKTTDKTGKEHNETTEKDFKGKWNNSLMRKIYSMYNPIPEDKKTETVVGPVAFNVGDSVSKNGRVGKITKDFGNGMYFVNFDDGGMGKLNAIELQNLNPTNQEISNAADVNAVEQKITEDANKWRNDKDFQALGIEAGKAASSHVKGKNYADRDYVKNWSKEYLQKQIDYMKDSLFELENSKEPLWDNAHIEGLRSAIKELEKLQKRNDVVSENPAEEHENRSQAMMGNDNAKKYGLTDAEYNSISKEVYDIFESRDLVAENEDLDYMIGKLNHSHDVDMRNLSKKIKEIAQKSGKYLSELLPDMYNDYKNSLNPNALSEAMMGNQNAKKDGVDFEEEKKEFKELVDRYNTLQKEFTSNGGYSNKRTTKEQDEKRRAARKGINEVEKELVDFRNKVNEKNNGSYKIPAVYDDAIADWMKRKIKGQTISSDWMEKKFGGYGSSSLKFGDNYSFSLGDTESADNPVVRIIYEEWGRPQYVTFEVGEMNKDQYRPRFMPQDSDKWSEVYKKFDDLRQLLNNAEGNTPAEKFYNTVLGENNPYSGNNTESSNIPRYRFTKDGIKDKNGKLEKINASVRNVGGPDEYIQLYADGYGDSIPSIFYPENDSDSMTDYFEKDSSAVYPDHPYYNHLKIMALKKELYRGRSTKWASMTKEQQNEVEKQIKELEKQLVEPTDEELKAYRERRDVQEENKEKWKEAQSRVYRKQQEEREKAKEEEKVNTLRNLLDKFAEAVAKEPPVDLNGLTKDEKITTLEDRILKLGIEINNLDNEEEIESKKKFREKLQQKLIEVRNEPDEETEAEKIKNRSDAMLGNQNAKKLFNEEFENLLKPQKFAGGEVRSDEQIISMLAHSNKGTDVYNAFEDAGLTNIQEKREYVQNLLKEYKKEKLAETGFRIVKPEEYTETSSNTVEEKKQKLDELWNQRGKGNGFELDKKIENARQELHEAEMDEKDSKDGIVTPTPKIDANVAQRINDISMSGRGGEVYQHDVNVEIAEFRDKFNVEKMNPQQKEYFQERLNSYAELVGSSYGEMASKRLSAGPSWAVAGPAKFNNKRYQQKMDSERRAYENFTEKKDKFIKNTEKKLKELKYTGGSESVDDVKQKVFDDYANGNYSWNDKIANTDPYAIEKISGKIKYMEDAHDVTLLYRKLCGKNGLTNVSWTDRTDEEKAKRKEVLAEAIKLAKEKGYSNKVIKEGIEHPFTQNQTADIRRNKERLAELQKRQAVIDERKTTETTSTGSTNTGRVDFDGGYVYENPEMDRIQIIYDGKPERDVIDTLKHNGFRWSPSQGAWQRQLNRNGRMAVNRVFENTGINTKIDIDGAGEVKKSFIPRFIIKDGRFLVRK